MPQAASDRKTQQILMNALSRLLQTKRFDDITVTDITHIAKLGRTTFYNYYEDKYDLMEHFENTHIDALCDLLTSSRESTPQAFLKSLEGNRADNITRYYAYIQQHMGVFSVLYSSSHNTNFHSRKESAVARHRSETMQIWGMSTPIQEYWWQALANVHLSLTTAFIRQFPATTPEEMSEITTSITRSLWVGFLAPEFIQLPRQQ